MNGRRNVLTSSLIFLGSVLVLTVVMSSTAWAKKKDKEESPVDTVPAGQTSGLANFRMVRMLENDDVLTGDTIPRRDQGAVLSGANVVVKLDPSPSADRGADSADAHLLSADGEIAATIEIPDPICTVFDSDYLFFYDTRTSELIKIDTKSGRITRFDLAAAELENVQGMAWDPQRKRLYLLDVRKDGPQIVDFNIAGKKVPPARVRNAKRWNLHQIVGEHGWPRGIAFDPQNGHLYVFNPGTEEIIELKQNGKLVARREVQELDMTDLKAVFFAPSSDGTDDPGHYSLFVVMGGTDRGEIAEWSLN